MSDGVVTEQNPENFFTLITPTHRMGNAGTFWCIERAHLAGVPFIWIPHPGDALIGRARSIEASRVLDGSYPSPYAIFLDSDIVFEPEDLMKLWEHLKAGKQLIGGCYVVRSGEQMAHYGKGENGAITVDGTVQEIDYLSTGFMGFTRGLLRKMVDELELPLCHEETKTIRCWPFFDNGAYYYEKNKHWIYESEDWSFCRRGGRGGREAPVCRRRERGWVILSAGAPGWRGAPA